MGRCITLDKWQEHAVDWLTQHERGILADEPGFGKSYPAIVAAGQFDNPAVFVVPAYLIPQWNSYLAAFNGVGPKCWSVQSWGKMPNIDDGTIHAFIDAKSTLIVDEAHRLRGRNSRRTRNITRLARALPRVWMLTGTPQCKSAGDLFPMLRICDPKTYSSYWRFVQTYCEIKYTPWGQQVRGVLDPEALAEKLRPWMLRRTFESCGIQLPEATVEIIPAVMTSADRKAYQLAGYTGEVRLDDQAWITNLLTAKRAVTAKTKVEVLLPLLQSVDGAVVIVTWYRETRRRAVEALSSVKRERPVFVIDADAPVAARQVVVDEWSLQDAGILVGTIASMEEGLNLQHGATLIFVEQHYLETSNQQVIARLRRRGQTRPVRVLKLVTARTIDDTVIRVSSSRCEDAARVLVSSELGVGGLDDYSD